MVSAFYAARFLLCVGALFTAICAFPRRISVTQSPYRGTDSNTLSWMTGNCINIDYNNIQTRIQLTKPTYNRDSFEIGVFNSSCPVNPTNAILSRTLPPSGEVFVNRRKPVCSYMLEKSVSSRVGMSFSFGIDGLGTTYGPVGGICIPRCSSLETISNYPHSAYFTRNGNKVRMNNWIRLFSDRGCTHNITAEPIFLDPQQPNNLVEITSWTNVHVKSFIIWY